MSDAPEIPEASTDFEKKIALSIAILAVVLSFVNNKGDNAKTDAIIQTNEASDQWSFYQSKSVKGHIAEMHEELLKELGGAALTEQGKQSVERLQAEVEKLGTEKKEIQGKATDLHNQALQQGKVNDRCDMSALLLQIGIVICSVAILSSWKPFWYVGMALGAVGAVLGVTAFLM